MTDPETDAPAADDGPVVVLLDVLPNGRPDDDRPQYRKSPVAYGLGTDAFRLYELTLDEEADVSVSHRLALDGPAVGRYREVSFDDLTRNAAAEIEYAVEDIVEGDEKRFVDFYNEAGPITRPAPPAQPPAGDRQTAPEQGTRRAKARPSRASKRSQSASPGSTTRGRCSSSGSSRRFTRRISSTGGSSVTRSEARGRYRPGAAADAPETRLLPGTAE